MSERYRRRQLFSVNVGYEVRYDGAGDPPATRLFLKLPIGEVEQSRRMVADEARFYRAFGDDPGLPLVRWVDASPDPAHPWLLLEDLSLTHFTPAGPLPASRRQTESMIDALARFHARWWEHSGLGLEIGERWDAGTVARVFADVEADYARFRDLLGDALSRQRAEVYQRVLPCWTRLAQRLVGTDRLTLIHGDAHAWNCLFPRDPDRHPAYLVDLATCRIRTPANDLAYMMAVMWFPDLRRRWERPLLRRYHERLTAAGVANYSWDDLWWDYRFAVIIHLFTPVHQAAGGAVPASTWWYNLERIHAAFDDLDCRKLI